MGEFDRFDALSFDCYGTLIDWETGIAQALEPWAARAGSELQSETLISAFGRHETVVQTEHPTWLYPRILAETMRRIGADLGVAVSTTEAEAFGRSVGSWPAFADSGSVLAKLKSRFKLVILSNVDRVSFRQSNDRLGVEFDLVITAEDVGSYKPQPANFEALAAGLDDLGIGTDRLLHVAESMYHDHLPAKAFGLRTAWIHRRHDKAGFGATTAPQGETQPDWQFASMADFGAAAT